VTQNLYCGCAQKLLRTFLPKVIPITTKSMTLAGARTAEAREEMGESKKRACQKRVPVGPEPFLVQVSMES